MLLQCLCHNAPHCLRVAGADALDAAANLPFHWHCLPKSYSAPWQVVDAAALDVPAGLPFDWHRLPKCSPIAAHDAVPAARSDSSCSAWRDLGFVMSRPWLSHLPCSHGQLWA